MTLKDQNKIKDYGHTYIKCSNCDAPLVDIWVVDKDFPVTWKLKANCPHCGDHSFLYEIKGRYYYGPGYKNMDKDDTQGDKDKIYTTIEGFDDDGSIVLINTKKGLDWNG